jgi:hypothetical protein
MLKEAEQYRQIARLSAPSSVERAFAALKRALASRRHDPAAHEAQAHAMPKSLATE